MKNNNLLTAGSISRGIFKLSLPMLVSAILQNLQSVIDMYWVGRLGVEAVAAVAVSGTILILVFPLIMGSATGTRALVARMVGAGDKKAAESIATNSIGLGLIMGLVIGFLGYLTSGWLVSLIGTEPDVGDLAVGYLDISFIGSFSAFVLFMGISILQAAGNTVVPMFAMLAANILNLILDPLMIFGLLGFPAMGVNGASLATVISQLFACVMILTFLRKGKIGFRVSLSKLIPRWDVTVRMLKIGIPGTGQMMSRSLMSLVFMRIVWLFGTVGVAAYGISLRINMILLMTAFVLGDATATIVGQCLGAGLPGRAARSAILATVYDLAIKVVVGAVTWIYAESIISFFNSDPDVVLTGSRYLRITAPSHIFTTLSIILGRAFFGAGDTVTTMFITVLSLWFIQVPLGLYLPRFFTIPSDGVWWAISISALVNGILVTTLFSMGKWKHKKI